MKYLEYLSKRLNVLKELLETPKKFLTDEESAIIGAYPEIIHLLNLIFKSERSKEFFTRLNLPPIEEDVKNATISENI